MQITDILNKKWFVPVLGASSLAIGAAGGYFIGKKRGVDLFIAEVRETMDLDNDVKEDSNQMTLDLDQTTERNPMDTPLSALRPDISEAPDPEPIVLTTNGTSQPVHSNVFAGNDSDWDYDKELAAREGQRFYILHRDEFLENELDFRQETITYYKGDDILADERDHPVYGYHDLMGDLNFGHGSDDPNMVYIRNLDQKMEWEVLLHTGHFAVEIQGLEIEQAYEQDDLRHSGLTRFRDLD